MTNVWPGTLPQFVQQDGFGESRVDNAVRSKNDDGSFKIRRRFTGKVRVYECVVQMTTEQLGFFETFYEDTLGDGCLPFDWVRPFSQEAVVFVFVEPYTVEAVGPTVVRVGMKLQTV